ncbi:site-specific integrase [Streptomyces sp. NPDC057411]|uniref:site-specific integrase n=1 Tax=unclassified Streptomyces TaxID=2593676 RepID=UPI00363E7B54
MPTWFEHATAYMLMKWPTAAAKHRASIAESLAIATAVFVTTTKGRPEARLLRKALYQYAFRAVRGSDGALLPRAVAEPVPEAVQDAQTWATRHSMKVSEAAKPESVRAAFAALSVLLNGKTAAENTASRKRMVLSNAFRYAVEERGLLDRHPFLAVDWAAPQTSDEVDFRFVPGPRLARKLLDAVAAQGRRGQHLETFFGSVYYAATRPGEAVALRETDFVLPPEAEPEAWGEVHVHESHPEVGSGWTDTGKSHNERGLKHRARKTVRVVPIPPVFVRMVRRHITQFGVAADGRIFRAVNGGRATSNEYTEVWQAAREEVLTALELATELAEVPYSLRHAAISLWIKNVMDPAEAAYRAGHSLAVLYRFYAKILKGGSAAANRAVEQGLQAEE